MSAADLNHSLAAVRLVAFDVDGVFTDGRFYLSDNGVECKAFSTQDGFGVRQLLAAGIEIAVISGRKSQAVEHRMRELGVQHIYLACSDKLAAFDNLLEKLRMTPQQCAYVGDDIPDLPLLGRVGMPIAVANAVLAVQQQCRITTQASGGFGAVREVCDMLLEARRQVAP